MKTLVCTAAIILMIIFLGCKTTSRIGFDDKKYFQEPPKIVASGNRVFLRWVYADNQQPLFAMFSESRIKKDSLFFYIPATTSSGKVNGRLHLEEIKDPQKLSFIQQHKTFWINPDGSLKSLIPEPMSEQEFKQLIN